MRSLRIRFAAIAVAAMLPATVAACGGSSSSSSSSEPPKQVLKQTFSNPKSIESGKLGINLSADVSGAQSGNFTADISGPFQSSTGSAQFPQLDLTAKVGGSGGGSPSISFEGALITTNSNAYIEYQGTAYQVPTQLYDRFKSAYQQQAQAGQAAQNGSSTSSIFKRLGIDPTTWLTNETNDGTTDVGGTTTIHISGDADVGKILTDLTKVAQSVPGATAQGISPSALKQVEGAVKKAHVDVYSGESDHLLRKLAVSLDIAPPSGSVSDVSLDFAVTLSDVNQPQTISAPTHPKPLSALTGQLGGLGLLGGLGGAGSTIPAPSGGGGGGSSSGGAPSAANTQAYLKCVQQAQGSTQKINNCLSKLQG